MFKYEINEIKFKVTDAMRLNFCIREMNIHDIRRPIITQCSSDAETRFALHIVRGH
jgi:hypothetical protein